MWTCIPKPRPSRGCRERDGIMIPGFAIAEAVQYDENYGFRTIQLQSIISLSVFARLPGNCSLLLPAAEESECPNG